MLCWLIVSGRISGRATGTAEHSGTRRTRRAPTMYLGPYFLPFAAHGHRMGTSDSGGSGTTGALTPGSRRFLDPPTIPVVRSAPHEEIGAPVCGGSSPVLEQGITVMCCVCVAWHACMPTRREVASGVSQQELRRTEDPSPHLCGPLTNPRGNSRWGAGYMGLG